jgi:hypothetical protein
VPGPGRAEGRDEREVFTEGVAEVVEEGAHEGAGARVAQGAGPVEPFEGAAAFAGGAVLGWSSCHTRNFADSPLVACQQNIYILTLARGRERVARHQASGVRGFRGELR